MQYRDYPNIPGFKIDSRFLLDHEDNEIDLGCLEAAINSFDAEKVYYDKVKLARESKDIVDVFKSNSLVPKHCHGWDIQKCGLTGKVSTVELAADNLYVYVPQFNIAFLSKVSELSDFMDALQILSAVIIMTEETSQEMKKAMDSVDRSHSPLLDPST